MAFPPPPLTTIDWPNLGFTIREVDGHVESTFSQSTGQWTPLKFVRDPYMRIHGMSAGLNYAVQAFEGMKCFRTPGDSGIAIFRPDRNARRMQHSADVLSMPRVPEDLFLQACRAAVCLNAAYVPPHETGAALYIRPQLYASSAQLGLNATHEYTFCVFVVPTGVYHGTHPVRGLILDEFDRAAPNGSGHAKVGGNYAPVLRWSDKARGEGFGITLHLDSLLHEDIDEFSTSAFIGVLRGDGKGDGNEEKNEGSNVTLVVPDSKCVIDSVTCDSVLRIAESFGWTVESRRIRYTELPRFSEVLAAGTAAALVPIRSITRRGSDKLPAGPKVTREGGAETVTYMAEKQDDGGEVCLRLLQRLKEIQQGKVEDKFGWRFEVKGQDGEGLEVV